MINIQKEIGDKIRELRKRKKLSQESLAIESELDRSYLGGVERGERNITIGNLKKITEALDVEIWELFK